MAVRTWANTLGIGAGAGLLTGAGQLGIGYGLGILRWDQEFATSEPWHAQLTWIAFLSGVAVVAGGYAGAWHARRIRLSPTPAVRAALALAAGVGAAVVLPLVIRPAAASHPAEGGDPRVSVALTAAAGLLIGVIAAFAALTVPAVSGSLVTTILWVWIVALIGAASTLGGGAAWATARLGLFSAHGIWVPLALLLPAALIALAVAGIARFGGSDSRAVGACGATGPALIGLAYLIAGPGAGSGTNAYRWALVAIAVGGAVSVGVAVARRRPAPATTPAPATAPVAAPVPVDASAPAGKATPTAETTPTDVTTPTAETTATDVTTPTEVTPPTGETTAADVTTPTGETTPITTEAASEAATDPPTPAPAEATAEATATAKAKATATATATETADAPARPWFRRLGRRKERPAAADSAPQAVPAGPNPDPDPEEVALGWSPTPEPEPAPSAPDAPGHGAETIATKPRRTRRGARTAVEEATPAEPVATATEEAAEPVPAPDPEPAPEPAAEPARETKPRRRTGLRRKRDGAEPEVRDPDGHLDWVKALRDDETEPPPA